MAERLTKEMREFVPILKKNGYVHARTNGSHFIFINRTTHKHISVNKDLKKFRRDETIRKYNLEV